MTESLPDLEHQLSHRFWDWMESVSWLKPTEDLYVTQLEPNLGIDIAAQLDTPGGERALLLIEVKETIRPSDVKALVSRLRERSQDEKFHNALRQAGPFDRKARTYLVLAARWLSQRTTQRIAMEEGVGWFDLAGNVHIDFPGVYLHAEGIANPYESKERTIMWTSRHAQRVLRELLEPRNTGRCWKQRDLCAECVPSVSLGTVNKVVKRLVESAYAVETDQGLRVVELEALLRNWGENYRPIHQANRSLYTTLHGDALQERLRSLFGTQRSNPPDTTATFALAGTSAAIWFAPFVRAASLYCYADPGGERALMKGLELQSMEKGANVTLRITAQSDAFRHRIDLPKGMTTTSMVQTYLDLQISGERGREAAEHLLAQKLKPLWNEWKSANP